MGLDIYLYRIKRNEAIKEGKRYNMQKLRNVYPNLHVLDSREMESICDTIKNISKFKKCRKKSKKIKKSVDLR